ncbi:MAG: hypothetical protein K0R29_1036 [Pseudobdellovibrio sp.]|nr:hypothetical protein [Pseudobdellovibrio sp.]
MTPNFRLCFHLLKRSLRKRPGFISAGLMAVAMAVPATALSGSLPFLFSADLPAQQKQTVLADLAALNRLQFKDSDGRAALLFGTSMNSENLKQWLAARSQYIVSENFNYSASVKVVTPNFIYPNADVLPYREVAPPPRRQNEPSRIVTVMTNVGAQVYIQGKKSKSLMSADIAGIGTVNITSPRTGLFKIGAGLFTSLISDSGSYISFGNSLRRLAVYFHEARHSDGNGKSLGFLHAPCPENKGALAGHYACDRNQNGPYTIEGTFLRSALDNCKDCSRREKEAIRNIYADKFNRVVTTGTVTGAAAQRLITDTASETCRNLRIMNVSASAAAACNGSTAGTSAGNEIANANAAAQTVTAPETRPAWLNEQPEGVTP